MIKKQDDFNNDNVYIGSTCNFIRRKCGHKTACNIESNHNHNYKLYKHIRENGGWNSWCMLKIIDYSCNNKSELNIMERKYIDEYKSKLNCKIPTRTDAEYRNDNREIIAEKKKKYNIKNYEKISEQKKKYNIENRDKIAKQQKQYQIENSEKIKEYLKKYHINNKNKIKEKDKKKYIDNKDKIKERQKQKVICDNCGCESTKCHLTRHKRTQKCINFNSK